MTLQFLVREMLWWGILGYANVIFVRIILSLLRVEPPPSMRPAFNWLYDVTEPFLRLFRRMLPPVSLGGGGLDLSPIIAFIVLFIVAAIVHPGAG